MDVTSSFKTVIFQDVTFDLNNVKTKPYKKIP